MKKSMYIWRIWEAVSEVSILRQILIYNRKRTLVNKLNELLSRLSILMQEKRHMEKKEDIDLPSCIQKSPRNTIKS